MQVVAHVAVHPERRERLGGQVRPVAKGSAVDAHHEQHTRYAVDRVDGRFEALQQLVVDGRDAVDVLVDLGEIDSLAPIADTRVRAPDLRRAAGVRRRVTRGPLRERQGRSASSTTTSSGPSDVEHTTGTPWAQCLACEGRVRLVHDRRDDENVCLSPAPRRAPRG